MAMQTTVVGTQSAGSIAEFKLFDSSFPGNAGGIGIRSTIKQFIKQTINLKISINHYALITSVQFGCSKIIQCHSFSGIICCRHLQLIPCGRLKITKYQILTIFI